MASLRPLPPARAPRSFLRSVVVALSVTAITATSGVVLTGSAAQAKPLGHKIAAANGQTAILVLRQQS